MVLGSPRNWIAVNSNPTIQSQQEKSYDQTKYNSRSHPLSVRLDGDFCGDGAGQYANANASVKVRANNNPQEQRQRSTKALGLGRRPRNAEGGGRNIYRCQ